VNISIQAPASNATVGWTFLVMGTYDLGSARNPAGMKPAGLTDSPGTIAVTVYQSDGTTPLSDTTVTPNPLPLLPGVTSGSWQVMVAHTANYSGCVIEATLTATGGGSTATSVSGVNISQVTPIPPIPPIPPVPPPPK
jgi:hypothetical protein